MMVANPTFKFSSPGMSTFTDLREKLRVSYRTGKDRLVKDFYVPCLERAILYRRAVGYFTSSGLAFAAQGVASLVARNGKMKIVASPHLEESDVEALRIAKQDPRAILRLITARSFVDINDLLIRERLNALAWLIADGSLEIRLALRLDEDGQLARGIYHEKIGIFSDSEEEHIAFAGSSNETAGGLVENFESIKVFWSWDDAQMRVDEEIKNFNALWNNETSGLLVLEFTEISQELLNKYRLTHEPLELELGGTLRATQKNAVDFQTEREIREYQKNAIREWLKNEGRGILAMATGTGKTFTALYLACRLHQRVRRLLVIVVCPYINLAMQWVTEMQRFGLAPVCCFRSRHEWEETLQSEITAAFSSPERLLPIVVVNRTFSSPAFQTQLCPDKLPHLIIADEVHNLGASDLRTHLDTRIQYRLGLSATPERYGDEEGTEAISDYFGKVVFDFPLKDAIEGGHLCRYFYHPVLVELAENEIDDYWQLTVEVARAMGRDTEHEMSDRLKYLLIRRARLLASASEKLPALRQIISNSEEPIKKALFYCGDGQVENNEDGTTERQVLAVCSVLGEQCGLRIRKFTCDEPDDEREIILENLRSGHLDGVVSIRCLDEGIDVPDVRLGFILASSTNPRQFIQRRGRLLRKSEGKSFAHIWDFIVSPPDFSGCEDDHAFNVERRLFQRELKRVLEFCATAENGPAALHELYDLRKRYNLLAAGND
jgi:DNA phosphorothioation system restriction enzyme